MRDGTADIDRQPRPLLLCAFAGDRSEVVRQAASAVVADGRFSWPPLSYACLPEDPADSAEAAQEAMAQSGCAGVLIVAEPMRGNAFQLALRALNRTGRRERITPTGPAVARATAPVAAMLAALRSEGLDASTSSEPQPHLGNYALYRVLTEDAAGPASTWAGAMRPPANASSSTVEQGLRAAALAYVEALALSARALAHA